MRKMWRVTCECRENGLGRKKTPRHPAPSPPPLDSSTHWALGSGELRTMREGRVDLDFNFSDFLFRTSLFSDTPPLGSEPPASYRIKVGDWEPKGGWASPQQLLAPLAYPMALWSIMDTHWLAEFPLLNDVQRPPKAVWGHLNLATTTPPLGCETPASYRIKGGTGNPRGGRLSPRIQ